MSATQLLTPGQSVRVHVGAMEIADRIRDARLRLKWTQEQLADAIGVSRGAVGQWEGGGARTKKPGRENLIKAARVLQIRVSDLLGEGAPSVIQVSDPAEIALLEVHRRLAPHLREIHLRLAYDLAGLGPSEAAEQDAHPVDRKRVGTR